ncbi:MAG: hypothetical protein ACP5RS_05315 [Thermoplasmata archaeon]
MNNRILVILSLVAGLVIIIPIVSNASFFQSNNPLTFTVNNAAFSSMGSGTVNGKNIALSFYVPLGAIVIYSNIIKITSNSVIKDLYLSSNVNNLHVQLFKAIFSYQPYNLSNQFSVWNIISNSTQVLSISSFPLYLSFEIECTSSVNGTFEISITPS